MSFNRLILAGCPPADPASASPIAVDCAATINRWQELFPTRCGFLLSPCLIAGGHPNFCFSFFDSSLGGEKLRNTTSSFVHPRIPLQHRPRAQLQPWPVLK